MFLVSALLGGGAWYLNVTGIFGGLSSSVLTFGAECTEESIKEQASTYRKTLIKLKKAESIREMLEAEITTLQTE